MCIIKYCHSHDQRASLESTLQNENAPDMILIGLNLDKVEDDIEEDREGRSKDKKNEN